MKTHSNQLSRAVSRRDFLRFTGLAGGAALVAACATPVTQPAGQTETGGAPAEAVTEISWWNQYSTATTQQVIPQIIANFEQLYPGVKVQYEVSGGPPGGGNYLEVLLARIAAGNPPNAATMWAPPVQFAAQGSLSALDEYMANAQWATADAFFQGPLESCRWQGQTYGLPAAAGPGAIFINIEKFEEQGISTAREDFPTTWQGLKELSAQLTRWENGELQQAGLVPWSDSWLKPVWSELNGGKIFDASSGQYRIDSAENAELLEFWVQWLDEQYGGNMEELNLYSSFSDAYPGGAFNQGLSAMTLSGSWACTDAEIPFEWEVMKFPVGPNGSTSLTGYWPNWFVVPAGVTHAQESFNFVEYWATKGWEIWYSAIMDTPAWLGFPEGVLPAKLVDEQGPERAQDVHNFFAESLESTAEMWTSPVENFASDTLDAAIGEVLHKVKTPEQALAESQQIIQARLDEALRSA
jgi:multiple sugar transport system substrate-binding protein